MTAWVIARNKRRLAHGKLRFDMFSRVVRQYNLWRVERLANSPPEHIEPLTYLRLFVVVVHCFVIFWSKIRSFSHGLSIAW